MYAYIHQQQQLLTKKRLNILQERKQWGLRDRFTSTIVLDSQDETYATFASDDLQEWFSFTTVWEETYMYTVFEDKVYARVVSHHKERQDFLLRLFLIGVAIAGMCGYGIGIIFVRWALRDVHVLAKKVREVDMHTISNLQYLQFSHLPTDDEIVVIAEALQDFSKTLGMQIQSVKDFVSHVSHELRTPLMILRAQHDLASKTQDFWTLLDKNTEVIDHMESLVDTLLMIAQVEESVLEKKQVDVVALVHDVISRVKQIYAEKDIQITVLWHTFLSVRSHAWSLERIVHNIIDNAYKYTSSGWRITVEVHDHMLSIADTWKGMTKKQQESIREPFWQADSTRNKDTWFGLWLYLVKRLVDVHGWEICVDSRPDAWTTFSLLWDEDTVSVGI